MKRILILMLVGVMLFSLAGCGGNRAEKIATLSDEEFCNELWLMLDEDVTDETLSELSAEEKTFYILSDFDFHFQCGGLAQYLYNTEGAYADEVGEQLRALELEKMAKIYEDFFAQNEVKLTDFTSGDFDYEELYKMYPLEAFEEEFYACYEETNLTARLEAYAREHILETYL